MAKSQRSVSVPQNVVLFTIKKSRLHAAVLRHLEQEYRINSCIIMTAIVEE